MSSRRINSTSDIYKELYELLGSKIQFKTSDGEYEGILKLLLPRNKRVTLEHVYYIPTREYMGNLNFFFREFLSYNVIETVDEVQKYEKWDYLSQILNRNYDGTKYRINDLFNDELDSQSETDENIPYYDEIFNDDFILHLPENLQSKLPHDNVILDSINTEFQQALHYISQQSVIGVSFEGPKISRLGKLSWVCISTLDCVFLFDIELLGKAAFDNGLKEIFESKNIEKVIHDCRQASDCLSHLFKTELVNVFDTQVADYIINMQRCSNKPLFKYVSSLDCCLVNHLDVPQEFLFNRKKSLSYDAEVTFFRMRPISDNYRNVVIKNALYLILLKESLAESMMNPFRKAVDVYLKVLANASEPELLLEPSVPDKIPPAILMQGIQTVHFQEIFAEATHIPLICKFKDPQEELTVNSQKIFNIDQENICPENPDINVNLNKTKSIAGKHIPQKDEINAHLMSSSNFGHKNMLENPKIDVSWDKTKVINKQILEKNTLNSFEAREEKCIEEMFLQNNKKHIDNIYHRLVNGLQGSNVSSVVDVKPTEGYVSNFAVKKSIHQNDISCKTIINSKCNAETYSNSSFEQLSETSADAANTSSDSSDTCSMLGSAFGVSCYVSEKSEKTNKKIHFLPAGMCF